MRRKDRELMPEEAWEIVDRCADGVVSMVDDAGAPYAVPVNLVREDNRVYFHSAMAGKKADCMRKHPNVCVACVESGAEIDQPGLTTRYASAILTGREIFTTASATPPCGASPWLRSRERPTGASRNKRRIHRAGSAARGTVCFIKRQGCPAASGWPAASLESPADAGPCRKRRKNSEI